MMCKRSIPMQNFQMILIERGIIWQLIQEHKGANFEREIGNLLSTRS